MSPTEQKRHLQERLVNAYERMVERALDTLKHAQDDTLPSLKQSLANAARTAVELGELTHEESEKVGAYLRRDLHDAASYVQRTEREFADWLRFDLELVEDRMADVFANMVDHTRLEMERLAEQPDQQEWYAGEIVGPGSLCCADCGHVIKFPKTEAIPVCPNCQATTFHRVLE